VADREKDRMKKRKRERESPCAAAVQFQTLRCPPGSEATK